MEEALEDWLYSSGGESSDSLPRSFLLLRPPPVHLAVAESCTGGMIAAKSPTSRASRSFLGGAVVYSDALKTAFAQVPPA